MPPRHRHQPGGPYRTPCGQSLVLEKLGGATHYRFSGHSGASRITHVRQCIRLHYRCVHRKDRIVGGRAVLSHFT